MCIIAKLTSILVLRTMPEAAAEQGDEKTALALLSKKSEERKHKLN
jgi:hypothetical protein